MTYLARIVVLMLCMGQPALSQPFASPQEAVERMMSATADADAFAMAGLYADGGLLMIPGRPVIEGRAQIEAEWRRAFADGFRELQIGTPDNRRQADTAASIYRWVARVQPAEGAMTLLRGRTLLFLERTESGWLIAAEMWQPDADAP